MMCDVDLNRSFTVQDGREHRHALFGENVRIGCRPPRPGFEIANCDFKAVNSSVSHLKHEVFGKPSDDFALRPD